MLVLARHGETFWNEEGKLTGQKDIPLTKKGIRQATRSGKKLVDIQFDSIYTSSLVRAIQTAYILLNESCSVNTHVLIPIESIDLIDNRGLLEQNHMKPVIICRELVERNFGILEGKKKESHIDEICSWKYDIPSAESLDEFSSRIRAFFKNNIKPEIESGKNILVVSHGMVMRVLTACIEGKDIDNNVLRMKIDNSAIIIYPFKKDGSITS